MHVTAATFHLRTQISPLDQPFYQTITRLRTIEKLSENIKNLSIKNRESWKTLASMIHKIVLGIFFAIFLTLFTCGLGGALLLRELLIQKQEEAFLQGQYSKETAITYFKEDARIYKHLYAQAQESSLKWKQYAIQESTKHPKSQAP